MQGTWAFRNKPNLAASLYSINKHQRHTYCMRSTKKTHVHKAEPGGIVMLKT